MTREALRAVLDGIDEVACVSGTVRTHERVAVLLPDGDVGAVEGDAAALTFHNLPASLARDLPS
jgi:hypothetical protein